MGGEGLTQTSLWSGHTQLNPADYEGVQMRHELNIPQLGLHGHETAKGKRYLEVWARA